MYGKNHTIGRAPTVTPSDVPTHTKGQLLLEFKKFDERHDPR